MRPQQNDEAGRCVYVTVVGIGRQHLSAVFDEGETPFTVAIPADTSEEALDRIALALAQAEISTELVPPSIPVVFDLYAQAHLHARRVAQDWLVQEAAVNAPVFWAEPATNLTPIPASPQR